MLKRVLILLLAGSWLLAACQGMATPQAQDVTPVGQVEPFATSEEASAPDPTVTNAPTNEASTSTTTTNLAAQAECTVVSRQPTPGPTQRSLFPSVSEEDWVKGPENADLTLIEYSDFQ